MDSFRQVSEWSISISYCLFCFSDGLGASVLAESPDADSSATSEAASSRMGELFSPDFCNFFILKTHHGSSFSTTNDLSVPNNENRSGYDGRSAEQRESRAKGWKSKRFFIHY